MGPGPHSSSRGAVSNRRTGITGGRGQSHGPASSAQYQQFQQYHVQPQKTVVSIQVLLICLLSCLASFYGGLMLGMNLNTGNANGTFTIGCNCQDASGSTDTSNAKGTKTSSSLLSGCKSLTLLPVKPTPTMRFHQSTRASDDVEQSPHTYSPIHHL